MASTVAREGSGLTESATAPSTSMKVGRGVEIARDAADGLALASNSRVVPMEVPGVTIANFVRAALQARWAEGE